MMRKSTFLKILLLILILLLNTENVIKAEKNFNKMRKELFDKWMKWIKETHSGKTIKLGFQYSFPFEKEIEMNEIFLKRAMTISKDTSGNIYIPDLSLHKIYKFSSDGHLLKKIDVLSEEGKLLYSFGECLKLRDRNLSDFNIFNRIRMCIGKNQLIYVAFQHFPIIREYSLTGQLQQEFKVKHVIMDMQEEINRNRLNRSKMNQPTSARVLIIHSIRAFNDKIYLLRTDPCLEILEIQSNGLIKKIYYWEKSLNYFSMDFLINEQNGERLFYILNSKEQRVDVFK